MMQMLSAGGIETFSDGQRIPDANNPRGYYEVELVKSLNRNPEVIAGAEGRAVKVVSSLLEFLPPQHEYRIIFMRRSLEEIVASQDRMLERLGQKVPTLPKEAVISAFERHLEKIRAWLANQPNMTVLYVNYSSVVENVEHEVARICNFLSRDLDTVAMTSKVEKSLHRERAAS